MYCKRCGSQISDEVNFCPQCGYTEIDYVAIIQSSKIYLTIGIVLIALGVFSWVFTYQMALFFSVIYEYIYQLMFYGIPSLAGYNVCDFIALHLSTICFLAVEFVVLFPRDKVNRAFRKSHKQLLVSYKTKYKEQARELNKRLGTENSAYRLLYPTAGVSLVFLIVSVFVPSLFGVK